MINKHLEKAKQSIEETLGKQAIECNVNDVESYIKKRYNAKKSN